MDLSSTSRQSLGGRLNSRRPRLFATLLAAMLLAASCSSADVSVEVSRDSNGDSSDSTGSVLAADVFDAEAVTVDGEVFDLAQLADSDLVLWFWAPW